VTRGTWGVGGVSVLLLLLREVHTAGTQVKKSCVQCAAGK